MCSTCFRKLIRSAGATISHETGLKLIDAFQKLGPDEQGGSDLDQTASFEIMFEPMSKIVKIEHMFCWLAGWWRR